MKIAIITDLHFGCRGDSSIFLNYFKKFYEEVFFPFIDANDIKIVVDMGDTFDRRKYLNYKTLQLSQEMLFDGLAERNIKVHMLVGNHDIYYKNTLMTNSPVLLLSNKYDNITVYDKPVTTKIGDIEALMVPWICSDNNADCMDAIENSKSLLMFSHLELRGFDMHKGQPNFFGENIPSSLDKFDLVLSGHYHTKSQKNNIRYLGTAYEMTWADYDDQKGFHVLDTKTNELKFIKNENYMFYKLHYDDTFAEEYDDVVRDIKSFDKFTDKFVKLIVNNKKNMFWFDKFIDSLTDANVHHLQIIEDELFLDMENDEEIINSAEDIPTVLTRYVDQLDIPKKEKIPVDKMLQTLYNTALTIQ